MEYELNNLLRPCKQKKRKKLKHTNSYIYSYIYWYVGSTTDLKARWRNHKSDTKLRKATKCGVADHVTRFPHPDDPQLDFLTIVAVEAVREKRNLIVMENY